MSHKQSGPFEPHQPDPAAARTGPVSDGDAIPEPMESSGDTAPQRLIDTGASPVAEIDDTTMVTTTAPYELRPAYCGRQDVLTALMQAVRQAGAQRKLAMVLLVGEPGMGKTRTIRELAAHIEQESRTARVLIGRGHAAPYAIFARLLARRFHLAPELPLETCQQRILEGVSAVLPTAHTTDVAHPLAHLMGIPVVGSSITSLQLRAPRHIESRTIAALCRFLAADAETSPLVLVLEDLDRCGAESIELLQQLIASLASTPLVILGTTRAGLLARHPELGRGDVPLQRIDLTPLPDPDAVTLLRDLCRSLDEVPSWLEARAKDMGGSPRAIQELVRFLFESELLVQSDAGRWAIDPARPAAAALPRTHDELMTRRLELLPRDERRLLEQAALIGESFWLDAVVALARTSAVDTDDPDGPSLDDISQWREHARDVVAQSLDGLVGREWLEKSEELAIPGEPEYRFVSPLLRALVYERIQEDLRCRQHRIAAQWLELQPGGRTTEAQEHVARHMERAGDTAAAAASYRLAADAARAIFLSDRAIDLYTRALTCLGKSDLAVRIQIWHDLGSVYELKGDFEAALRAFEHMLQLSWLVAARTKAAVAFNKMGRVWRRKGDLDLALDYLERAAVLFEQTGDDRGVAGSLDDIGKVLYLMGRYEAAHAKISAALARRERQGDSRSIATSLSSLGNVQRARGRLDEAQRYHQQALDLRRGLGDRLGVATSLDSLAALAWERGETEQARIGWQQAVSEAQDIGALPVAARALCHLGELALAEGRHDEAHQRIERALGIAHAINDQRLMVESLRCLAQVENALGNPARARELAHRAHAVASSAGLREAEAQALVCLGDVYSTNLYDAGKQQSEIQSAEAHYEHSIDILRDIGHEPDLARALDRFGRYKLEHGERVVGESLLREALAIYSRLRLKGSRELEALLATI